MHKAPATTALLGSWQIIAQTILPTISTAQPIINMIIRMRYFPTDLKLKNGISLTSK